MLVNALSVTLTFIVESVKAMMTTSVPVLVILVIVVMVEVVVRAM